MTTQLAQKLAAEAVKQSLEKTQNISPVPSGQNEPSQFRQLLGDMSKETTDFAKSVGMLGETGSIRTKFDVIPAEQIKVSESDFKTSHDPSAKNTMVDFLSNVNDLQGRMDSIVSEVLYSGKKFSMQELMAIQAQVFHVAQVTELTVKVADQGVSSTKTVLNTQIQ